MAKDALGNPIVIGAKYGYASSVNGIPTVVVGVANLCKNELKVTLREVQRRSGLYGEIEEGFVTILLSMWYNGQMIGEGGKPIDETNPEYYPTYIKSMWDAGHIKVRGYTGTKGELWDPAKEYFLTKNEVKLSMEECYLIMSKNWDVKHRKQNIEKYFEDLWNKLIAKNPVQPQLLNFVIDWEAAGWTINDYENTPAGAKLFMQAIDGMLSDEDTKDWEEWISERSE